MKMCFRWFGPGDPIPLNSIRQIPGVKGVVSALHDVPAGQVWPKSRLDALAEEIDAAGLELTVVESIPVHEDIKLGRAGCERYLAAYAESILNVGEARVRVLCYNFMPVFDWMRTDLEYALPDRSTALAYDHADMASIDISRGTGDLPGWATAYSADELATLRAAYADVTEEQLWENLARFIEYVAPVAEGSAVQLALHPDDPPWPILGLPRIITSGEALQRVIDLDDSPANGITFCTGSLAANPDNDLPAIIRQLPAGRIHFAHCRNIRRTGEKQFHEVPHPSEYGDVNMLEVTQALAENSFDGPIRPDHGRMIWGEKGRPGYGLHDRALGATYLCGLWEAVSGGG